VSGETDLDDDGGRAPPAAGDDSLGPDEYRSLVEGVPAILYIDEPDEPSSNRYTSPQVVAVLGFTPQEWHADPHLWMRQLHPDDRERVLEAHHASNESGERFFAEYRLSAHEGREVWIRDEAVLVRDDEGRPRYWRGVMLDITEQKRADDRLRWSLDVLRRTVQERRELARRLERAQEEERRRIAADIHDDPIQVMAAVDMRLQLLAQADSPIDPRELEELRRTVSSSIERLRHVLFELRPMTLDREGLVAAIRMCLDDAARETGWEVSIVDSLDGEPPSELGAMLYRIVQEAITNARKHAVARRVDVLVAPVADGVAVRVRDDGCGFDPVEAQPGRPGHLGLPTMAERAELLGGWCRVTSAPGSGTTVECWIPVDRDGIAIGRPA
jgi:PAS domain S-box-containing protein